MDRKNGSKTKEYALIDANIYRDIHTKLISNLEHAASSGLGKLMKQLYLATYLLPLFRTELKKGS